MFRLNRIKPHGRTARMNSRSARLSSSPDTPVMKALVLMGPISPRVAQGSRKRALIPLDDALSASRFQTAAEMRRFIGRPERSHHGAIIDAFVTEIGPLDHRRARSQHRRELVLQRPKRALGVGLVPLRGDLDQVPSAAFTAGRGLNRVGGGNLSSTIP